MKKLFPLAMCHLAVVTGALAQISVPAGGTGTLSFATRPPASEWATRSLAGNDSAFTTAADLNTAVATNLAAGITAQLTDGLTANPPAAAANAAWTGGGGAYVLTRPTGVGATLLMAKLRNDTGADANTLDVSYTFSQGGIAGGQPIEQVPGHQVYYSLTGLANSWVLIPELSGATLGPRTHTLNLAGNWAANGVLYLLWADDNTPNGTDYSQQIDDISFTAGTAFVPLSVTLTAPANGQLIVAADNTADVVVSALVGGTVPATSVRFLTNGVPFATLTAPPYTALLPGLAAGTYAFEAEASNGGENAISTAHTLKIRPQFVDYTGGVHAENFDGMGPMGSETPVGWYVGSNPAATAPAPGVRATVGDGSVPPDQSLFAWNYGLPGDDNRALATLPSATDRHTVLRLRNLTSSNLVSFEFFYDGECWRPHTNFTEALTNFVSFDRGSNWVATGYDFVSPVPPVNPATALNGHDVANRLAGLGGTITPPLPVPPGGVIYLRWFNINEANTDGALAIDNFTFRGTAFSDATAISFTLNTPTNGQVFSGSCGGGAAITATASAGFFVTNVTFQLDGGWTIEDAAPPFSAVFNPVPPGTHTLLATARDSFGVVSNHSVTVTVVANQLPEVALTNVFSGGSTGLVFLVGSPVTNQFGMRDADGTITNVEFLVNGVTHFATNTVFGQIVVGNALAGTNTFTVRAMDNCGGVGEHTAVVTITNPPPPVSILISNGSNWRYYSSNSEPPALDFGGGLVIPWNDPFYDDSAWPGGRGELGAGDAVSPPGTNPERTLIDIGPAANRHRTIYFRHTFSVADPAAYGGLIVRSLHDDGSAIYLNGTLVATFNLTNGVGVPITYSNLAQANGGRDGTVYAVSNLTAALVSGLNCVAVEIHQDAVGSSDLSFDLMLWAVPPAGPTLSISSDGLGFTVSWSDPAVQFKLQRSTDLSSPANWLDVPGDPGSPYTQPITPGGGGFYRLIKRVQP